MTRWTSQTLFTGMARGNFHQGGLLCRRLFRIEDAFFSELVREARLLVEKNPPSSVAV